MENVAGFGHIFDDPDEKEAMLNLRLSGLGFADIAVVYGVDHTTIIYHCKKAGLIGPFRLIEESREKIGKLFGQGRGAQWIARRLRISSTLVRFNRGGVKSKRVNVTLSQKLSIPPRLKVGKKEKPKGNPEKKRPGWRLGINGEWICLGKTIKEHERSYILQQRKRLHGKRIAMLVY